MAIVGGFILILIGVALVWIALMSKFKKIGNKVTNKVEKTFAEEKESKNDSSN